MIRIRAANRTATQQRFDRHRLERAIELYLADCYARRTPARASELASFIGVDRRDLVTVCVTLLGMRPRDVLRDRRLAYAQHLLRTTRLAVSDIVRMTAFGTERTFNRSFVRAFGMTPESYRRDAG